MGNVLREEVLHMAHMYVATRTLKPAEASQCSQLL